MTAPTTAAPRARPDNILRLHDGRILGYAEYGDPAGRPAFLFHGFPGSRCEAVIGHDVAARAGIRLLCPDRPGMGLSSFQPGRTILHWPADVVELADGLGIERFAVGGVSGGGPYAAACALRLADRLTSAAIISGVGPFDAPDATQGMSRTNRALFLLGRRAPWLSRVPILLMARAARSPARAMQRMSRSMAPADRAILRRPEVGEAFKQDFVEAFRGGARGPAWELVLFSRPWGFRLQDIAMEVRLWQGGADANVPEVMGRSGERHPQLQGDVLCRRRPSARHPAHRRDPQRHGVSLASAESAAEQHQDLPRDARLLREMTPSTTPA